MPLSGPTSYVPTINAFLSHWEAVNLALGAGGPLVLPGGAAIATLTGHRDSLQTLAASVQGELNDREIASASVDLATAGLLEKLGEFNRKVRGFLGQTPFVRALPLAPQGGSSEQVIVTALDDMATLWTKINAATIPGFTPPLLLLGGYAVAPFSTALAALKVDYQTYQDAGQDLKLAREQRNDVQDVARAVLRDYRAAVLGSFAPTDALVASLPDLTPPPGSTPDAVTAGGLWDAASLSAKLTWSPSGDPALDHYEIRFTPGSDYSTDDESVVGSVLPTDPLEFFTQAGLAAAGNTASFKVYVVLTTGNERGSNTVTITRP
jgi:hypothetical protein